jgi:hypothetical protein
MTWKPPIVQQNNYILQQKSTFYRNSSAVATIFDRLKFIAVEVAKIAIIVEINSNCKRYYIIWKLWELPELEFKETLTQSPTLKSNTESSKTELKKLILIGQIQNCKNRNSN